MADWKEYKVKDEQWWLDAIDNLEQLQDVNPEAYELTRASLLALAQAEWAFSGVAADYYRVVAFRLMGM